MESAGLTSAWAVRRSSPSTGRNRSLQPSCPPEKRDWQDPETTKSTVVGDFRVYSKHITTTMASEAVGEEFELKDIPYVQYFREGYALHAAYWHDDFGTPRSHGCVNLAPDDARWLFWWTEPTVYPGWHSARSAKGGTVVSVHP